MKYFRLYFPEGSEEFYSQIFRDFDGTGIIVIQAHDSHDARKLLTGKLRDFKWHDDYYGRGLLETPSGVYIEGESDTWVLRDLSDRLSGAALMLPIEHYVFGLVEVPFVPNGAYIYGYVYLCPGEKV